MKTVLITLLIGLLGLLGILLIRTMRLKGSQADWNVEDQPEKAQMLAKKLSTMVKQETISYKDLEDPEKFEAFHETLRELFPLVFSKLTYKNLNGSLLLEWPGQTKKKPILLLSHMDVVEAGANWSVDPFSGEIKNGNVYGRGSADTKASLMAFLQATEELLETGFQPERTVYLASSCSEETMGPGAVQIVSYLKEKGVHLSMVIDEGGAIIEDPMPGISGKFAMIGLFEKGQGNVKFTATGPGGHASMPSRHTPLSRLADFIHETEKNSPMDVKLSPELKSMFKELAPFSTFWMRLVFGNLWFFSPILEKALPYISPQASAMLQTTIAFTMAEGSGASNVIPQRASVTANLRFIPHQPSKESIEKLEERARKHQIETEIINAEDPSPILDLNSRSYQNVKEVVRKTFGTLPVIPYIVTGATDARHFHEISDACVRFIPVVYGMEQMKGMHGVDECISISCLPHAVEFYKQLILSSHIEGKEL